MKIGELAKFGKSAKLIEMSRRSSDQSCKWWRITRGSAVIRGSFSGSHSRQVYRQLLYDANIYTCQGFHWPEKFQPLSNLKNTFSDSFLMPGLLVRISTSIHLIWIYSSLSGSTRSSKIDILKKGIKIGCPGTFRAKFEDQNKTWIRRNSRCKFRIFFEIFTDSLSKIGSRIFLCFHGRYNR